MYLFKRSYNKSYNTIYSPEIREKILPLGLNYHVTYPGNPIDSIAYVDGIKNKIIRALKNLIKHFNGFYGSLQVTNFESARHSMRQPKIIFLHDYGILVKMRPNVDVSNVNI